MGRESWIADGVQNTKCKMASRDDENRGAEMGGGP